MSIMKKILILFLIVLIASYINAFTIDEAINYVSKTNNYLLDNERAALLEPQTTINSGEDNYWIIAGQSGTTTNIYLPLNNKTNSLAQGDIVVRELIKTSIVLNRIYDLKNSYPVNDWPFSYSNQTRFYDLGNAFSQKVLTLKSIKSELLEEELIIQTEKVESLLEKIDEDSKEIAELIGEVINFENKYFTEPNTNQTNPYKKYFEDYFEMIQNYKTTYNELDTELKKLQNGIAISENIASDKKNFYLKSITLPAITSTLPSFFNTNDSTKTLVEKIFSSANNVENLVSNLETRKERNEAWKVLYGNNNEIIKLNNSFTTLEKAAEAILNEDNVDYWKDQASVSALKTNWSQAKIKFQHGTYNKAREFGTDAEKNVTSILKKGYDEITSNIPEGLIIQIVIILIVAIIGLFVFEKFYLKNKDKEKIEYEEDYDEKY